MSHEPLPDDFNVALNESRLLSAQIDRAARKALLWFEVLSLPPEGPANDGLIAVELTGVTRIAASLREGQWDDIGAPAIPLPLDQFDAAVRAFGGSPIYGWEFVDPAPGSWQRWKNRLSTDEILAADPAPHVIELFQEGATNNRILEFRVWFVGLGVMDRHFQPIAVTEFTAGGRRWWDGLFAGDSRVDGKGIIPTAADGTDPPPPLDWPS